MLENQLPRLIHLQLGVLDHILLLVEVVALEPGDLAEYIVDGLEVRDSALLNCSLEVNELFDFAHSKALGVRHALFFRMPSIFELVVDVFLVF